MSRLLAFAALLLLAGLRAPGVAGDSCPAGALPHPETQACVSVIDISAKVGVEIEVPSLAARRLAHHGTTAPALPAASGPAVPMPTPGGIGSGLQYRSGQLRANNGASLQTYMNVYWGGIGPLTTWLYETSTNRTQLGVEVVGIWSPSEPGALGIFDWSCSPSAPCSNGATSGAWVVVVRFTDHPCFYKMRPDQTGQFQNMLRYNNDTLRLDPGGQPLLWRNQVTVFNWCSNQWQIFYTHDYVSAQMDCAAAGSCGWWGPIIETFHQGAQPAIAKLGFAETTLVHDSGTTPLLPANSDWVAPPSQWQTFYRTPNHSWGVGSFLDDDGDGASNSADADDDNDGRADASEPSGCQFDPDCDNDNVSDGAADPDGPGQVAAGPDNCFTRSNPDQSDIDTDGVGDACDPTDYDADGYSDRVEYSAGTDPGDPCADGPTDAAWPPDFNNDTVVDVSDLAYVSGYFGQRVPPAPARADIAPDPPDGFVDITDVGAVANHFGGRCQ